MHSIIRYPPSIQTQYSLPPLSNFSCICSFFKHKNIVLNHFVNVCVVLHTHTHRAVSVFTPQRNQRQTGKRAGITRADILAVCWMLARKAKATHHRLWGMRIAAAAVLGRLSIPPALPVCPPGSPTPSPAKIHADNRCWMQLLQSKEGKVPPLSATFWLGQILMWPESSFENMRVWFWVRLTEAAWGAEALQNWKSNSICVGVWSAASGAGPADWHLTQWRSVPWAGHWWHLLYPTITGLMTNTLVIISQPGDIKPGREHHISAGYT